MPKRFLLSLAVWAVAAASNAHGAMLIFQPATGSFSNFGELPQGYGNRITATTQDGFRYSLDGGATPNVVVQHSTGGMAQIYTWDSDFGDLHNVVFAKETKVFEMDLVADAAFLVQLNSFDMAGWPHLDFTIASVQVLDGNGNTLFSQQNVDIEGNSEPTSAEPEHTHFAFSGVQGSTLRILFDSTTDGSGHTLDSDDVGIDNINFSQLSANAAVPEPTSLALLAIGASGFLAYNWRRRILTA